MGLKLPSISPELPKIILRVPVGAVFAFHGTLKVLNGIGGFISYLSALGVPYPQIVSYLVIATEFFGGLALIFGIFARWATLPLIATMAVAIIKVTGKHGFNITDNGYEYNMVLIACLVVILAQGSGKWSIRN